MMDLYLEGQRIDLAPNSVFAVTVQSNDITKPDTVQSSYSNRLTVPYTQRNHRILENAAEVGSMTLTPYRKLEATVLSDGVEVLPLPRVFVDQASEGYELQVFSGALDLFARMGDKSICDLNLSRFNHVWNAQNVTNGAAHTRTYQDGYIYNPIANGKPGRWAEDMHPSVFVRAVFEQLLTEAGVKYTGIEDELWDRLILPFSNDKPLHTAQWLEARRVDSDNREGQPFAPIPVTDYGRIKAKFEVFVTSISEDTKPALMWRLRQNGVILKEESMPITTLYDNSFEVSFDITPHYSLEGLELVAVDDNISNEATPTPGSSTYRDKRLTCEYDEEAYFKTEWALALNLPDISQKDFFKAVRALFDLMPMFDPYSNTVTLTPFNKLLENKPKALDWSRKLVYLRGQERMPVQYRFGSFAQRSWWRYKADELGGNGDAYLLVDDEQLEREKDMVTLPFAASEDLGGYLVVPLFEVEQRYPTDYTHIVNTIAQRNSQSFDDGNRVYVKDATDDPLVREGWAVYERIEGRAGRPDGWDLVQQTSYKRNKLQPRLAVLQDLPAPVSIRHTKAHSVQIDGVAASFAPISFASLLTTRYRALQGVLDRTKGITPWFLLSPGDVANYDPSVPIWLDQFQDYFYLNQITEFTGDDPTECQLWRL